MSAGTAEETAMPKNGNSARKAEARALAAETGQTYAQALDQVRDLPARHRGTAALALNEFGDTWTVHVLAEDGTEWGPYDSTATAGRPEQLPTGDQIVSALARGHWTLAEQWDDATWTSAQTPDTTVAVVRMQRYRDYRPGGPRELAALAALDRIEAELTELHESEDMDPYRRAALLSGRAMIWDQLGATRPNDPAAEVDRFTIATAYAAILDQEQAARIRIAHRIPSIHPASDLERLHLDDLTCPACGRLWQPGGAEADRCPQCPALLVGATPTSREEAATLPAGEPYTGRRNQGPRQAPAPPAWHTPGRVPPALRSLRLLDAAPLTRPWRELTRTLADARAALTVREAAAQTAWETDALFDRGPSYIDRAAGWGQVKAIASELGRDADEARNRYVALAVHALAAAAGLADPAHLPDPVPMGEPGYVEAEAVIPVELAAAGYLLPAVHSAMPEADRARQLEDDHAAAQEDDGRSDEIGLLWEKVAAQSGTWADAVTEALAGELRPAMLKPDPAPAAAEPGEDDQTD